MKSKLYIIASVAILAFVYYVSSPVAKPASEVLKHKKIDRPSMAPRQMTEYAEPPKPAPADFKGSFKIKIGDKVHTEPPPNALLDLAEGNSGKK